MMEKQVYIWLIISALVMSLTGCNRMPDYDARLIEADSLVYDQPQQAKAILDSINREELSEADEAYYNLLLTQAVYINYDNITSDNDSIITQALDYFSKHKGDKEKLTRSYIYKGAVTEELALPDSVAMVYYKKAESSAGESDRFNRGYAQMRMGKLYIKHQAFDGRDIEKLEQAVENFTAAGNNHYQILSLRELGANTRFRDPNKADYTLNKAINLTESEKDTANYIHCVSNLAYLYFMQGAKVGKDSAAVLYNKAYGQLQRILKLKRMDYFTTNDFATCACVYAMKGKPDSALKFIDKAKERISDSSYYHSHNYLVPMAQIAKASGNMLDYYKLSHESDSIDFALMRNPDIFNIMYAEINYDQEYKAEQDKARRNRNLILSTLAGLVILSLLLLALLFYRRAHRYDRLVIELKDQFQNQMHNLTDLQDNISEMKINDERLKGFISSHTSMMREMIEACYHEPNNRIAENMKRIVKFQESNRDNWVKLYDYIDLEHNNIMTRTRQDYPELNDKDLLLLALTCMGYSYIQTAIVMGYSNATSVSVLKQRLAKKMGLDCSLNEYIDQFGKQEN